MKCRCKVTQALFLLAFLFSTHAFLHGSLAGENFTLPESAMIGLMRIEERAEVMSVSYNAKLIRNSGSVETVESTVYFDGRRFYQSSHSNSDERNLKVDRAFDGVMFNLGNEYRFAAHSPKFLMKYSVENDDPRDWYTIVCDFGPLEYFGFDVPARLFELRSFFGVRSRILEEIRLARNLILEYQGPVLRLRFIKDDPIIAVERKISAELYRENLAAQKTSHEDMERLLGNLNLSHNLDIDLQVEVLLDSERGYTVIERTESKRDQSVHSNVVCEDFFEVDGLWFPRSVRRHFRTIRGTSFYEIESHFNVNDVSFSKKSSDFTLDYETRGTNVIDRFSHEAKMSPNKEVTYIVGADGTLLRGEAETIYYDLRTRRRIRFFLTGCLAASLIFIVSFKIIKFGHR